MPIQNKLYLLPGMHLGCAPRNREIVSPSEKRYDWPFALTGCALVQREDPKKIGSESSPDQPRIGRASFPDAKGINNQQQIT
jgi:hypothetical protein